MKKEDKERLEKTPGTINAQANIAAENTNLERFHARQGHGFAAERANDLYDSLTGHDAKILGDNNAKNGADRLVDGVLIQSKYCQNATKTVNDAFRDGQYRYLTPDGKPMQLEVPFEQYDDAIAVMKKHISNGDVPNVTDPKAAEDIVRKGQFTYEQAKKFARAGTIESLTYDAVNGTIVAANTFGITATITFALSCWNGDDIDEVLKNAARSGLQAASTVFATNIIVSQLNRVGLNSALVPVTEKIVKTMGSDLSAKIANGLRTNAYGLKNSVSLSGQAAMNFTAKAIRTNIITSTVMVIIVSAKDVQKALNGDISGEQLLKNVGSTISNSIGGNIGYVIGAMFGPTIIGPLLGSAIGGIIGTMAYSTIISAYCYSDETKFKIEQAKKLESIALRELEKQHRKLYNLQSAEEDLRIEIQSAFKQILESSIKNDFSGLTSGLNAILDSYGKKVPFSDIDEFENFLNEDRPFVLGRV